MALLVDIIALGELVVNHRAFEEDTRMVRKKHSFEEGYNPSCSNIRTVFTLVFRMI